MTRKGREQSRGLWSLPAMPYLSHTCARPHLRPHLGQPHISGSSLISAFRVCDASVVQGTDLMVTDIGCTSHAA
eukprot:5035661-Prymnesium_polylepis.1